MLVFVVSAFLWNIPEGMCGGSVSVPGDATKLDEEGKCLGLRVGGLKTQLHFA